MMGVGPAGNAVIGSDRMREDDSYLSTFVPFLHPALAPGPGLNGLSDAAVRYISESLAELDGGSATRVELFAFVRRQLLMATTEAIYGPKNPFRDPALEKAWLYVRPRR